MVDFIYIAFFGNYQLNTQGITTKFKTLVENKPPKITTAIGLEIQNQALLC